MPRIDIGNARIQESFEEWTVGAVAAADFELVFQQEEYIPSIDPHTVTMTVEAIEPATDVNPFSETFVTAGVADDLRGDGVAAVGGLRLTISGLFNDQYFIKSFHYETTETGTGTEVEVYISLDGGVTFYYDHTYEPAVDDATAHEYMIAFSNEVHPELDIVVEFRPTQVGQNISLNALQFVPEPSTGLLLGLALLGLTTARRRRRL